PKDGDRWRVNFSRVEWKQEVVDGKYRKVPKTPEDNWVWSPQGVIDMHRPETCGVVQFSTAPPGTVKFVPDPPGPARHAVHRVYAAQRAYHDKPGRYAATLAELGLADLTAEGMTGTVRLETIDNWFQATGELRPGTAGPRRWRIRADARVWGE